MERCAVSSILKAQQPQIASGIAVLDRAVNVALPAATPQNSVNPMQIWVAIGATLWVAVAVGLVLYSLLAAVRLNHRLKSAVQADGNLYEVQGLPTAFVFGFPHAKIYLPAELSNTEKSYILRHEQTHIKRLDHLVKPLAFLVLCVHWFNPLAWIAFFMWGKDMELSCDERVIKELGGGIKQDYSASLLALSTGRRIIGGCPLAFGENDTKGRIKNVLNYKKPALWVAIVAVLAVVAVSVGLMANPLKNKKEYLYFTFGIDATILEIDNSNHTMLVAGTDQNSKLGERCFVTCDQASIIKIINEKPVELSFEELAIGDKITMDIGEIQESNPSHTNATRIQLLTPEEKAFFIPDMDAEQQKFNQEYVEPILRTTLLMRNWSTDNYTALLPDAEGQPDGALMYAFEDILGQEKMQPLWNQYNGKFPEKVVEDVLLARFPFTTGQLHEILASYYKPNEKIYAYEGGRGGGPIECAVTSVTKQKDGTVLVEYLFMTNYYADAGTAEKDAYSDKTTGTLTLKPTTGGGHLYQSVAMGEHTEISQN